MELFFTVICVVLAIILLLAACLYTLVQIAEVVSALFTGRSLAEWNRPESGS